MPAPNESRPTACREREPGLAKKSTQTPFLVRFPISHTPSCLFHEPLSSVDDTCKPESTVHFSQAQTAERAALSSGVLELPVPDTDAGLVVALRAGRQSAKAALFDRYGRHVQRVLSRVLGPDPDIQDLLQDVFVSALESIDRLSDPNALRPWLSRIAVFTARGRIRRRVRWRFIRSEPMEELTEVEANSASAEVSEALRATYRVLNQLPPDERIAFALRFIDGMELTEVAEASEVSLATIKRRLVRAQRRFVDIARHEPSLHEWLVRGARWTI
jgi:RNA polymerase sigma-70 factor (ECF subfamily)